MGLLPCPGPLLEGPPTRALGRDREPIAVSRPEDRCSLARLLFGLGQAQVTGSVRVLAPSDHGEEKHELFLRLGRVVHVKPPHLDEPLGHILRDMGLLDPETYARSLLAMAEERARHGTVLRRMGVVSDEQIAGALALQILRRSARMFRIRGGRYAIDPYDHEHGREEDGIVAARGIGVRRVIYNGVLAGYRESDLVWELNLLAGRRVRLRREEARRLGRYGFGPEARATLDALASGFGRIEDLTSFVAEGADRAGQPPEEATAATLRVLYALLVTEMLEVEVGPQVARTLRATAPGALSAAAPPAATPRGPRDSNPGASTVRPAPVPPRVRRPGLARPGAGAAASSTRYGQRGSAAPRERAVEVLPAGGMIAGGAERTRRPAAGSERRGRFRRPTRRTPAMATPMGSGDSRTLEGRARFLRGEACLRAGDIETALANLRAAATLLPGDADVRAALALAVWRHTEVPERTRAAEARRLLAEAIGLAPGCARAYRAFGILYADAGQIEQAIRCFVKVLELEPGDEDAVREIKRLERLRCPGDASFFGRFRRK